MPSLRAMIRPSPSRFAGPSLSPQAGRGASPLSSLTPPCRERARLSGICTIVPRSGGPDMCRVPATVITGFFGAGKKSLVRDLPACADGRRLKGLDRDTISWALEASGD